MENKTTQKPSGYWTFEKVKEEALKYNTRGEFSRSACSAYVTATKNKWLDDVCSHMKIVHKPHGYWTFEKVKEEALKYNTRGEFGAKSHSVYVTALRNNWLDDVCTHMVNANIPSKHWTFEKVKEEALKYNTRGEFLAGAYGAYHAAERNKWLDEVCTHVVHKPHGYWTFEKVKEEALKYNTRGEFQKSAASAYSTALRHKWMVDACAHMDVVHKPKGYWSFEKIKEEALKYNTRGEFQKGATSAYSTALHNNWLDDACAHMVVVRKPKGYWTFEKVKEEALKYNTRGEFQKGAVSAYSTALKHKWLNDACAHMKIAI